jgi:small subunit ribosomal protein S18
MAKKKVVKRARRIFKKKPCKLCRDKVKSVSFKEVHLLEGFVSDRGKIIPPRISGNCSKHQRMVARAIKQARIAALLPFVKIKGGLGRESDFGKRRGGFGRNRG